MAKKLLLSLVSVYLLIAAVAGIVAFLRARENRLQSRQADACLNNMRQLNAAAQAYVLEYGGEPNTLEQLNLYVKDMSKCVCPLETNPYSSSPSARGPTCPNSEAHTKRFQKEYCQDAMSLAWEQAVARFSKERELRWGEVRIGGMRATSCPLAPTGTVTLAETGYPPFSLTTGPRCPYCGEHNLGMKAPPQADEFLRKYGHLLTNEPAH